MAISEQREVTDGIQRRRIASLRDMQDTREKSLRLVQLELSKELARAIADGDPEHLNPEDFAAAMLPPGSLSRERDEEMRQRIIEQIGPIHTASRRTVGLFKGDRLVHVGLTAEESPLRYGIRGYHADLNDRSGAIAIAFSCRAGVAEHGLVSSHGHESLETVHRPSEVTVVRMSARTKGFEYVENTSYGYQPLAPAVGISAIQSRIDVDDRRGTKILEMYVDALASQRHLGVAALDRSSE